MKTPPASRILVIDLFAELHSSLLSRLQSLSSEEWHLGTVCSEWCVKDIAAHLLDGDLRRLSAQRDQYRPPDAPIAFGSSDTLVKYLNELNSSWTRAARRLSPQVLVELLAASHSAVIELFRSLDPDGPAIYGVGWAGEERSANWFDVAREFTERRHHQAQIRLAVGRMGDILTPRFYRPVLDTFLRALPYTFRDMESASGTEVELVVDRLGTWTLERSDRTWTLLEGSADAAIARVAIPSEVAWRVFTKRMPAKDTLQRFPEIRLEGNRDLAARVLETVSIMA